MESYYYDSSIFGNALNESFDESASCQRILDPAEIGWMVSICSELIAAETTFGEYVSQFEITCASAGVVLNLVEVAAIAPVAKKHNAHKKALANIGFSGVDWKHLMAALSVPCRFLVTTDQDFFDPANKAKKGGKGQRVSKYFSTNFSLSVVLPSAVPQA